MELGAFLCPCCLGAFLCPVQVMLCDDCSEWQRLAAGQSELCLNRPFVHLPGASDRWTLMEPLTQWNPNATLPPPMIASEAGCNPGRPVLLLDRRAVGAVRLLAGAVRLQRTLDPPEPYPSSDLLLRISYIYLFINSEASPPLRGLVGSGYNGARTVRNIRDGLLFGSLCNNN